MQFLPHIFHFCRWNSHWCHTSSKKNQEKQNQRVRIFLFPKSSSRTIFKHRNEATLGYSIQNNIYCLLKSKEVLPVTTPSPSHHHCCDTWTLGNNPHQGFNQESLFLQENMENLLVAAVGQTIFLSVMRSTKNKPLASLSISLTKGSQMLTAVVIFQNSGTDADVSIDALHQPSSHSGGQQCWRAFRTSQTSQGIMAQPLTLWASRKEPWPATADQCHHSIKEMLKGSLTISTGT